MCSLEKHFPESDIFKYRVKISCFGETDFYWFHAYDCAGAVDRLVRVRDDYTDSDVWIYWDTLSLYDPVTCKWIPCILR